MEREREGERRRERERERERERGGGGVGVGTQEVFAVILSETHGLGYNSLFLWTL